LFPASIDQHNKRDVRLSAKAFIRSLGAHFQSSAVMAFLKVVSLVCLLMTTVTTAQYKGIRLDLRRQTHINEVDSEPHIDWVDRRRSFGVYTHENFAIPSLYVTSYSGTPPQRINLAVSLQYANTFMFGPGSCGLAASAVCPGGTCKL